MVPGLEPLRCEVPSGTDGVQDRVVIFPTAGNTLDDDVGDTADQGRELDISCGGCGLKLFDSFRDGLGRRY